MRKRGTVVVQAGGKGGGGGDVRRERVKYRGKGVFGASLNRRGRNFGRSDERERKKGRFLDLAQSECQGDRFRERKLLFAASVLPLLLPDQERHS